MKLSEYLKKLIEVNSGASSKAFFLVMVTLTGCFLLFVIGFVLIYEVINQESIRTDLGGMAALVGSVGGIFAAVGATKVISERKQNKLNNEKH